MTWDESFSIHPILAISCAPSTSHSVSDKAKRCCQSWLRDRTNPRAGPVPPRPRVRRWHRHRSEVTTSRQWMPPPVRNKVDLGRKGRNGDNKSRTKRTDADVDAAPVTATTKTTMNSSHRGEQQRFRCSLPILEMGFCRRNIHAESISRSNLNGLDELLGACLLHRLHPPSLPPSRIEIAFADSPSLPCPNSVWWAKGWMGWLVS